MIEKVVYDFLSEKAPVNVYMERPEVNPAEYCLIEKTGSTTADRLTTSTIAVQSYGRTLYEAAALNAEIIELMLTLPLYSGEVSGVKLNSDGNFTNPATKEHRYQAAFTITHY